MAILDVTPATELQEAYDASSDGTITVDGTRGAVKVVDSATPLEDDVFDVRAAASSDPADSLFRISTDPTGGGIGGIIVNTDVFPSSTSAGVAGGTDRVGKPENRFLEMNARRAAFVRVESGSSPSNITFPDSYAPQGGVIAGRISGDGALQLGGGSYPAAGLLGSATAVSGATGRLQNLGGGSVIMGSAFAGAWLTNPSLAELFTGAYAYGCFVGGYALSAGTGGIGRVGVVNGGGSIAWGYASGTSGGDAQILLQSSNGGAAFGHVSGNGTNRLQAISSSGSMVQGRVTGASAATIEAYNAPGGFAQGIVDNQGQIRALAEGAMARGRAIGGAGTLIEASGTGSLASGRANSGSRIRAQANGAVALGVAQSYDILASGIGSFAAGRANTADIEATGSNSFQLGPGSNGTDDSLQVGTGILLLMSGDLTIGGALDHDGSTAGFFGTAPVTQPTITGSRGGNAALTSLLTELAGLGLIVDSTTA